jgi:hypothetical protein
VSGCEMKSVFDDKSNSYNVTISKSELEKAFTGKHEMQIFMHEIVANTYGEWTAEVIFPLMQNKKG